MNIAPSAQSVGAYAPPERSDAERQVMQLARALESRWAPVLLGLIASCVVAYVWGGPDQIPYYHDEMAYLLQAKLFATWQIVGAGRPLPEFFEQYHVLVTPLLAAKYPPGHSLMLVPGIWLGIPGLMPALLVGASAALLFIIARRVANVWVAVGAWLLWTTAPGTLRYLTTYLSQSTSVLLWLAASYALLEWRSTGQRRWLVALAAVVGFGSLTRPLTMLAFAIPAAAWALRLLVRWRAWRDALIAAAVTLAFVAVTPFWNVAVTGSPSTTPHAEYARLYIPWDAMGFGLDTTPPARALPNDMQVFAGFFRPVHERYTPGAVPGAVADRARYIGRDMWGGWRVWLAPLAVAALFALSSELAFAGVTVLALVLAYLAYAHPAPWSVYYLEAQPLLALLTAVGAWRVLTWGAAVVRRRTGAAMRPDVLPFAMLALVAAAAFASGPSVTAARGVKRLQTSYHRAVRGAVEQIPERAIVFVRYAPGHNPHASVIDNAPDLASARVWMVYDRGAEENGRLLSLAPDRAAYLFDEAKGTVSRVAPAGAAPRPTTP